MIDMQDYHVFNEAELERIGVVCKDCNTEVIFDLTNDQTATGHKACPGCNKELLKSWEVPQNKIYNWVTYYKGGRDSVSSKPAEIRFYFKR